MVMPETDPILDSPDIQQKRPFITVVLGAIVVIAICASAWFLFHTPSPNDSTANEATIKIKMNSTETEYLANIHVKDVALSRAENFLHQEVTILSGTIVNNGPQTVIALDRLTPWPGPGTQIRCFLRSRAPFLEYAAASPSRYASITFAEKITYINALVSLQCMYGACPGTARQPAGLSCRRHH